MNIEQQLQGQKLMIRQMWRLSVLLVLAVFCCRNVGQEIITYQGSDGQIWIMNSDGREPFIFMPDIGKSGLKWSPNGRQAAFNLFSDQGIAIWVINSDGSKPHPVTAAYEDIGVQAWLNDHILLVGIRSDMTDRYSITHYRLDLQDGSMQSYSKGFETVVPSPTGNRWITQGYYTLPGLTLYSLDQEPQKIFSDFWIDPFNFDVSPSGQEVVVCGTRHTSDGMRVTGVYRGGGDSTAKPTLVHTLDSCGPVDWSPDGQHIALLGIDNTLLIFDTDTHKIKYEHTVGPLVISSFIWSPSGDTILVTRHYGKPGPSPKELARVDIKTGAITRLTDNNITESSPQWLILR